MPKYKVKKKTSEYSIEAADLSDAQQIVLNKEGIKISIIPSEIILAKGIDISHWQGDIDWSKVKTDFAIIKATQGTSYIDPKFEQNKSRIRKRGILLGYYHFAVGADFIKEAKHFVKTVGEMRQGEFLVLDWEVSHADPVGWCRKFLDKVYELTGIRPILYTNEARLKSLNWSPVVAGNYGLWVAKYGVNNGAMNEKPQIGAWKFYVIWQYTSKGRIAGIVGNVDLNIASTNLDTLKKYGKK